MRRRLRVAAGTAALVVLAACSREDPLAELPPPPPTASTTSTTAPRDLSSIALAEVPGRTTTTVVVGPGQATLAGTVTGPDGPVPGAVVRAERFVGDAAAAADVVTSADGTWRLPGVLGGRYRVRAWRTPDLAMTTAEVFFLEGRETKTVPLRVERFSGLAVTSDIAPDPPIIRQPASLVVQVTVQSVDDAGIVRAVPQAAVSVELFGTGDWRIDTPNPVITDGRGRASWQLRCGSTGEQPMSVIVGGTSTFPLSVPACTTPPTTTTTTAGDGTPTTTIQPGTTSTTRPRPRTTTTTAG